MKILVCSRPLTGVFFCTFPNSFPGSMQTIRGNALGTSSYLLDYLFIFLPLLTQRIPLFPPIGAGEFQCQYAHCWGLEIGCKG